MTAPSLIGFGLVFLAATAVTSLVAGAAPRLGEARLRSLGAWSERRAAALTLLVPPAFGALLVGVLVLDSVASLRAGTDHCAEHSHHLHICLVHGAD